MIEVVIDCSLKSLVHLGLNSFARARHDLSVLGTFGSRITLIYYAKYFYKIADLEYCMTPGTEERRISFLQEFKIKFRFIERFLSIYLYAPWVWLS